MLSYQISYSPKTRGSLEIELWVKLRQWMDSRVFWVRVSKKETVTR